jgi:hypothetical protein
MEQRGEQQAELSPLSAEVLSHTLRQVAATYREYNESLFSGRLKPAQLEWTQSESEWGAWVRAHRTLRLTTRLIDRPWGELVEVLKHEMAHQYVDEIEGLPRGEGPHGETFRKICNERGIDAAATGAPTSHGASEAEPQSIATLKRIEHLLALAQSDHQNEAEAAMSTARRLMLKYNLQEAAVGATGAYSFRHLGKPTGRRMAWQRVLANLLSDYFFVDVIIVPVYRAREGKRGSVIEAVGTQANLKIAAYAHDFLERTAIALWKKHKKEAGLPGDRDKQSYLYGVMSGFSEKLEGDAEKHQADGLVWLGDPELGRYFRARHPHVRHVTGRARVRGDAFSAGHDAGGRIVLHRGVEAGSTKGAPRLLGSGRRK